MVHAVKQRVEPMRATERIEGKVEEVALVIEVIASGGGHAGPNSHHNGVGNVDETSELLDLPHVERGVLGVLRRQRLSERLDVEPVDRRTFRRARPGCAILPSLIGGEGQSVEKLPCKLDALPRKRVS